MYLLMNNHEVRSQRIACPPAEVLESTCQLFSLPFRYEKRSGIFAVHPPLLGKNILIESIKPIRLLESQLHSQLMAELWLLEQLLWVSGAEVVLRDSSHPEEASRRKLVLEYASHWDVVLLVFPGQSMSDCVEPLAIYPWWQWACASYRLAGHLAAGLGPSSPTFTRASSLKMTKEMKTWFSETLQWTNAPTVLLSVPLIDGYVDQFVELLSLTVSHGVLKYFKKQPLPAAARDYLRRASDMGARVRVPVPVREAAESSPTVESLLAIAPGVPAYTAPATEPPVTPAYPITAPEPPVKTMGPLGPREVAPVKQDALRPEPPAEPQTPEQPLKEPLSALELAQADLAKHRDPQTLAQKTAAWRDRMQRVQIPPITQVIRPNPLIQPQVVTPPVAPSTISSAVTPVTPSASPAVPPAVPSAVPPVVPPAPSAAGSSTGQPNQPPTQRPEQEHAPRAAQELTRQTEQEPRQRVAQQTMQRSEQESGQRTAQPPAQQTEQAPAQRVSQQPAERPEQTAGQPEEQQPAQRPDLRAVQQTGRQLSQAPSLDSAQQAYRWPAQRSEQEPGQQLVRQLVRTSGQEIIQQVTRESLQRSDQGPGQQPIRQPARRSEQEPAQQAAVPETQRPEQEARQKVDLKAAQRPEQRPAQQVEQQHVQPPQQRAGQQATGQQTTGQQTTGQQATGQQATGQQAVRQLPQASEQEPAQQTSRQETRPAEQESTQRVPQFLQPAAVYQGPQSGRSPIRQYVQTPAVVLGPSSRRLGPGAIQEETRATGPVTGVTPTVPPITNLPRSQRDDERLMQLRQMLLESPETAVKQAAEVLSSRGISPTPEKVEEYVEYLNRMVLRKEDSNVPD